MNLGLRYDVTLPRTDRYNRQNWFDPNVTSPLNGGSLTYTDPVTGQPVTLPLKGGEVFATSEPAHELRNRLEQHSSRASASPISSLRRWWCAEATAFTTDSRARASLASCPTAAQGFNQYTNVITDLFRTMATLLTCT